MSAVEKFLPSHVMVMVYTAFSKYTFKCGLHYFSTRVKSDISIYVVSSLPGNFP